MKTVHKDPIYNPPKKGSRINAEDQCSLVREAIDGSEEAKERLWEIAFPLILFNLRKSSAPRHTYPDIIQEWALRFFSSLGDFDPGRGASPMTFFFRRSLHTIRDFGLMYNFPMRIGWRSLDNPPKSVSHELIAIADLN